MQNKSRRRKTVQKEGGRRRISLVWLGPLGSILGVLSDLLASWALARRMPLSQMATQHFTHLCVHVNVRVRSRVSYAVGVSQAGVVELHHQFPVISSVEGPEQLGRLETTTRPPPTLPYVCSLYPAAATRNHCFKKKKGFGRCPIFLDLAEIQGQVLHSLSYIFAFLYLLPFWVIAMLLFVPHSLLLSFWRLLWKIIWCSFSLKVPILSIN